MAFMLSTFDLDGLSWTVGVAQDDDMDFFLNCSHKKKETINWLVPLEENSFTDSEAKNVLAIDVRVWKGNTQVS